MRSSKRDLLVLALVAALPRLAHAGGFEILEQSTSGVGTAGAQAARAEDPSAVFYNPAGMAFQRGFGGLAGANIIHADTAIKPNPPSSSGDSITTTAQPYAYGVQRLGSRFAVGLGGFANFGQLQDYPGNFSGRFLGRYINITTLTIDPSFAVRPFPWLAIGIGLDIMPASIEIKRALNFGGGEGTLHDSMTATGVGGNLGLLVRIVPQYLTFGFTYRSAMKLDFSGKASIDTPPELYGAAQGVQGSTSSLTMPHNFTFALSTRPIPQLSFDVDVHYTLWHEIQSITLKFSDPKTPPGASPLLFKDAVGVRVGGELRLLPGHRFAQLALRLGAGWDMSPEPAKALAPLAPDADRAVVGGGVGFRYAWFGIEASYLATILLRRTATNPDFQARYDTVAHIVAIALTLTLPRLGEVTDSRFKN
jgi:long-chain fatty acid transport protein